VPRIRTWHRVSHDFTNDPEVWELRRKFGDWMGFVWLRMLAVSDRKGGLLRGDRASIAYSLSSVSGFSRLRSATNRILNAFQWMSDKGWIELHLDGILIVKHPDYRERREHIEIPKGKPIGSLQEEKRQEETRREEKDLSSDPTSRPSESHIDPVLQSCLQGTQSLKTLANGKHGPYWDALIEAYDHYEWLFFEVEIKKADAWIAANPNRKPTDKGLPRFFRSWIERAVEKGRKHGKKG